MATRLNGLVVTAMAWIALTIVMGIARADGVPLITGKQWAESSDQLKKAYLFGVANLIQVVTGYHAGNAPSDSLSIVPRLTRRPKGHSLDSVRQGSDRWYAAHPDQLQRPVIETIWFEMVPGLPGKSKAKP